MAATVDRREHAVLLACVQTPLGAAPRAIDDTHALDWPYLASVAEMHGLSPLVAANLSAARAAIPPDVAAAFERQRIDAAARALSSTAQLASLQRLLGDHGVRAVAFKGPTLGVLAYGSAALRRYDDLDVLVPRGEFRRVRRILVAHGYALTERDRLLDGIHPAAGREDAYWPSAPGLMKVEVHVALALWPLAVRLDPGPLLARAIEIGVAGRSVLTLCPDDLLLVLALHGLAHRWTFLKHASEVDAVARLDLDWDAVAARAREARMQRILFVAMLVARELFATRWPSALVAAAERDARAGPLARGIAARFFTPAAPRKINPRKWALFLQSREHRADQVRYCTRALFAEWILKLPWDLARRDP